MPLTVEVVYALPGGADTAKVRLCAGATLGDAIERSGLLERHPEIDLGKQKVGVFGKTFPLDRPARDGDRVEIYRPLAMDPKEARRRRAENARNSKPAAAGGHSRKRTRV